MTDDVRDVLAGVFINRGEGIADAYDASDAALAKLAELHDEAERRRQESIACDGYRALPCPCDAGQQGADALRPGPHHDDDCERHRG